MAVSESPWWWSPERVAGAEEAPLPVEVDVPDLVPSALT